MQLEHECGVFRAAIVCNVLAVKHFVSRFKFNEVILIEDTDKPTHQG